MDPILRSERDGGRQAPLGHNISAARRGMRPAGISGLAQRVAPVDGSDVKVSSTVRPLSVEAVEFSPALVPEKNVTSERMTRSSGAGGVAPAVVADPPVPTAAGVTFSAVAEVHVSASATEDDSSIAQASEQRIVCGIDSGTVPETLSVLAGDTLITKPMKHLAQKIDLDGTPMEEIVVLEPLAFSVPDISLDSRPMAGNMDWNPSEHAVPEEDQTSRPMEGVTDPEPLGHSVTLVHLDSRPGRNELKPEWPEHPVPDDTPRRIVGFYDNQTVSDHLGYSNTDGSSDPVPMPAPSELAEHSTSVGHSFRHLKPEPSEHPAPDGTPRRVVGFSDNQPVSEPAEQSKTCDDLVPKPIPSELTEQPGREGLLPGGGHCVSSAAGWVVGSRPGATTVKRLITDGSTGHHRTPAGIGRGYCNGRDWFSGTLVSHRMGPRGRNGPTGRN